MSELVARLQSALIPGFWPMFLATTVGLVVLSVWTQRSWTSKQTFVYRDWGVVTTLAVGVPLLLILLGGAAFAYHDNDVVLENTVHGRGFALAIWPDQGRYFPLFAQEFDVLKSISATPGVYYGFIAVQLVVMCVLLNVALAQLSVPWRTLATALALYASGTVIVFVEAVYPERNIVFLLVIFIVAIERFDVEPSRLNMSVALVAAHAGLYFKEPFFLLVATVALFRLVVFLRQLDDGSRWRRLSRRPLELGLLATCVIFGAQFLILLLGPGESAYVRDATIGPIATFGRYLRMEPLLLVFVAAIVLRIVRWRRRRDIDATWDALACGAVLYFFALVVSGLAADRYMGPIELIAALFATREVALLWANRPASRPWAIGVGALATVMTLGSGAFRAVEHTSVVSGTEELADFVADYAATHEGQVRLYFPDAKGFRIMNFASYLDYAHGDETSSVTFAAPLEFSGGQCVGWLPYACESDPRPRPGDLVVQLPDDATRDVTSRDRQELFSYSWLPGNMPDALGQIYYVETPLYTSGATMPTDWLTTSVEMQN